MQEAQRRGLPVVGDIELFAREAEAPIAAVTGTNGKSTVTTLVATLANAAGRRAVAGGNLGEPALDLLEQAAAGAVRAGVVELPARNDLFTADRDGDRAERYAGPHGSLRDARALRRGQGAHFRRL